MMKGSLARKLRVLRAMHGLTQVEAAERIGITPLTISELERGKRRAYMPTLVKIARGYDVPVQELLEEPELAAGKGEARQGREMWLEAAKRSDIEGVTAWMPSGQVEAVLVELPQGWEDRMRWTLKEVERGDLSADDALNVFRSLLAVTRPAPGQ